jgi:glyoxylase-like metal-dependent hydrolase (beta-lactamase superfamily II)
MGKYRINGQIDQDNMVLRVQTWVPNPVLGDMFLEHRYTMYKDYNGVKFPGEIHSHSGLARTREGGHNLSEVLPTTVQPNVTVAAVTVPDAVRQARIVPARVESERLANGVWHLRGGSHHSVLVEFRDHLVMIEAPQNEERSLAVIAEAQRLVPNKPIRYVVNTHHHFDHSGGIRTYVAQSAILVGHESNRDFYERQLLSDAPRTVEPDILSSIHPWFSQTRYLAIEGVNDKYVLSDGVRTLDLYLVQGLNHATGMLIAYLPAERILINADLYSPPAPGAAPPTAPTATMTALSRNVERLGLNVDRHVGIHGGVGNHADFMRVVQAPAPARD